MSAFGIDFGNENTFVCISQKNGIETIINDYSELATPSYVAFGPKCRIMATAAKNQLITNLKNTVYGFKRLIGKKHSGDYETALLNELTYLPYRDKVEKLSNGSIGVKVNYLQKQEVFTIQQICAMFLTKLKEITKAGSGNEVTDCVISVPLYFTDAERRALLDICQIVNINVLRLLNETTAVAVTYGYYNQHMFEAKPRKVCFIDMGHSAIQASICNFYQGNLTVLCSTWNFNIGGRNFDHCIADHFSKEFKDKYGLNVLSNHRALVRLIQESEKLKKQLSANPQDLPLNIECLMDDKDVNSKMGRDTLEKLCEGFLKAIGELLHKLLAEAKLSATDIDSVELVGGSMRIPAVKRVVKKVFGVEPSTTLNMDEAVARGCALQARILLQPIQDSVNVRTFRISDVQPYSIKVKCRPASEHGAIEVFPRSHQVPFSKLLTFFQKEDFVLDAYYVVIIAPGIQKEILIGSFCIKVSSSQHPLGDNSKVIVKIRVDIHGIFNVVSAVLVDHDFKENPNLDQQAEDMADIKAKRGEIALSSPAIEEKRFFSFLKRPKKVSSEMELQIETIVPQLSLSEINSFRGIEEQMILNDCTEERRINAKNSLEESLYEMKSNLSEDLASYVSKEDYISFMEKLNKMEVWISDEGQDESEENYTKQLADMKAMIAPAIKRKEEFSMRPHLVQDLNNLIEITRNALALLHGDGKKPTHISSKSVEKVEKSLKANEIWVKQLIESFATLKPSEDPPILVQHIEKQIEIFRKEITPLVEQYHTAS